MFEFKNVLDVTYRAYVVNGAYGGISNSNGSSAQAPASNQAVAVIRELLAGNTAAVRLNARDASTAVSIVQTFTKAIDIITAKLIKMQELAKKAHSGVHSQVQVEEMQTQFWNLAEEINQTINGTEYHYNKPFTADGKTFSIPIGNGSKIDIFARDFRFDPQGLNIATDPWSVLSAINDAITNVSEYNTYLDRQAARLSDATEAFELEMQSALGVDIQDFQPELAVTMADYVASLISQDKQTSLNTQANITPDETLKLLEDNNYSIY